MLYVSGEKTIDLMYTNAPADDLWWDEDTDADFDILELSDFRVCVAAWNYTTEEYNYVCDAVRNAASAMEETSQEAAEFPSSDIGHL